MSTTITRIFKNTVPFAIILFITLSCSDNDVPTVVDEIDEDMETAAGLADLYIADNFNFTATAGRKGVDEIDNIDKSITVLKLKRGQLMYKTNTDTLKGYYPVTETTVTASVEPGELIFWFAGAGISTLDSIDFDSHAVEFLDELPTRLQEYSMWVVKVPENYDPEHNVLKYDIVYEIRGQAGVKIRLDPKIVVGGGVEENDDDAMTN
tara:strand:- start:1107 stop:1730 length:624 start_codon:yes stop_codon:yes gene_type:complete